MVGGSTVTVGAAAADSGGPVACQRSVKSLI